MMRMDDSERVTNIAIMNSSSGGCMDSTDHAQEIDQAGNERIQR